MRSGAKSLDRRALTAARACPWCCACWTCPKRCSNTSSSSWPTQRRLAALHRRIRIARSCCGDGSKRSKRSVAWQQSKQPKLVVNGRIMRSYRASSRSKKALSSTVASSITPSRAPLRAPGHSVFRKNAASFLSCSITSCTRTLQSTAS